MHARLIEKSFVLSANAVDDPGALAAYVHPDTAPLKPLIGLLDRLGYLRPASLRTNSISEIASPEPSDPARYGGIEHSGKPAQGKFVIAGWGIVPEKRRAADAVLLTCDDPNGEAHIFAIAVANLPRPDLVTSDQLEVYRNCGWMKEIDLSLIANGSGRVRAWAFDAEERRAYPMNGFADVSP